MKAIRARIIPGTHGNHENRTYSDDWIMLTVQLACGCCEDVLSFHCNDGVLYMLDHYPDIPCLIMEAGNHKGINPRYKELTLINELTYTKPWDVAPKPRTRCLYDPKHCKTQP